MHSQPPQDNPQQDEVEVTPEMIRAGFDAIGSVGLDLEATCYGGWPQIAEGMTRAFRAMLGCSRVVFEAEERGIEREADRAHAEKLDRFGRKLQETLTRSVRPLPTNKTCDA